MRHSDAAETLIKSSGTGIAQVQKSIDAAQLTIEQDVSSH